MKDCHTIRTSCHRLWWKHFWNISIFSTFNRFQSSQPTCINGWLADMGPQKFNEVTDKTGHVQITISGQWPDIVQSYCLILLVDLHHPRKHLDDIVISPDHIWGDMTVDLTILSNEQVRDIEPHGPYVQYISYALVQLKMADQYSLFTLPNLKILRKAFALFSYVVH